MAPPYSGRRSLPDPTKHGTVHSIDPTSGKLKWSSLIDGVVIAPVTVANGVVYVGSTKGFEIRDAASGSLLWNDGRDDIVYSQPVVVDGSISLRTSMATWWPGGWRNTSAKATRAGVARKTASHNAVHSRGAQFAPREHPSRPRSEGCARVRAPQSARRPPRHLQKVRAGVRYAEDKTEIPDNGMLGLNKQAGTGNLGSSISQENWVTAS